MGSVEHARARLLKPIEAEIHCNECFKVVTLVMQQDYYPYHCPTEGCTHRFHFEWCVMERSP